MVIDYDAHWKYLIRAWFKRFIRFFMPRLYYSIDFSKPPEFLDKELDKIRKDGDKKGNKRCDHLIKVYMKNGEEKWCLIHVEVQQGDDKEFAKRMFQYYYRIYDLYEKEIEAVAIFTGGFIPPKPHNRHVSNGVYRTLAYGYATFKVKDYKHPDKQRLLEENENPFALVILASLAVLKTKERSDDSKARKLSKREERMLFKLKLIELAKKRDYDEQTIDDLFTFIRYIVALPAKFEEIFEQTLYNTYANPETMKDLLAYEKEQNKKLFDKWYGRKYDDMKREAEEAYEKIKKFEEKEAALEKALEKERALKVEAQEKEKAFKLAQQREIQRLEASILNLYKEANFSVDQIVFALQVDKARIISVLKKHGITIQK